jgi:hypothetical protein
MRYLEITSCHLTTIPSHLVPIPCHAMDDLQRARGDVETPVDCQTSGNPLARAPRPERGQRAGLAGLGGWSLGLGPVRDDNQGHLRTGGPLGTGAEMRPVEHQRQGLSSTGALALGHVSLSHQRVSVNLLLPLSVVSTGPSGLWENRSPESALRKGNTKRAIAWTIGRRVEVVSLRYGCPVTLSYVADW